ncbi:hypothetical protein PoB_006954900 [Plakobranchus ocellatus]|uniref:Uncharacterized protein n=1 Tax=Plakobranchus ocellatus TaxID=259542 RepID=A0AAV4DFV0_9GAST|nr:hypothetical protein PoB_006954900 [Plakobranchus ocellatus]
MSRRFQCGPTLRRSPHRAWGRSGEAPVMKSDRKPEFFHESRESPPTWGTRNFTACSKRPGTSLGRSSGESPRLGRCVQEFERAMIPTNAPDTLENAPDTLDRKENK